MAQLIPRPIHEAALRLLHIELLPNAPRARFGRRLSELGAIEPPSSTAGTGNACPAPVMLAGGHRPRSEAFFPTLASEWNIMQPRSYPTGIFRLPVTSLLVAPGGPPFFQALVEPRYASLVFPLVATFSRKGHFHHCRRR